MIELRPLRQARCCHQRRQNIGELRVRRRDTSARQAGKGARRASRPDGPSPDDPSEIQRRLGVRHAMLLGGQRRRVASIVPMISCSRGSSGHRDRTAARLCQRYFALGVINVPKPTPPPPPPPTPNVGLPETRGGSPDRRKSSIAQECAYPAESQRLVRRRRTR